MIDPRHPTEDLATQFLLSTLIGFRAPDMLQAARIIADGNELDWNHVWSMASEDRITPLLYLGARNLNLLPEWFLDSCRQDYLETGVINTLRQQEIAAVLRTLRSAEIDVIALKGLALADRAYGNLAVRPMADIDLLVRRKDARDAVAILEEAGYGRVLPELAPGSSFKFENETLLWKRDGLELAIELHWSLFDSPFFQHKRLEDSLWSSAEQVDIAGASAGVLSPEIQLVYLCGHLVLHHRWQGLLWWQDVIMLLDRDQAQLKWQDVVDFAAEASLVIPLQTVLSEVARSWSTPVPGDVLVTINTLKASEEEVVQIARLTEPDRTAVRRLRDDLLAIPDWSDRLRFLGYNLFPSAAYMDTRYEIRHPALRPAYYIGRWLRGVVGSPSFAARMSSDNESGTR